MFGEEYIKLLKYTMEKFKQPALVEKLLSQLKASPFRAGRRSGKPKFL